MTTNHLSGYLTAACVALAACAAPTTQPSTAPGAADGDASLSTPPPPLPAEPLAFPPFEEAMLPNGLRLIVLEDSDLPVLNVDLYIRSGAAAAPPELAGLAGTVAEMLTKGTPTRSAQEISRTIEGAGGTLGASAANDFISVGASVLADQAPLAFELLADVALRPTFPEDELDILRTRLLSSLQAELAQPGTLASRRFSREVYGEQHPYSTAATPATIERVQVSDLSAFHDDHFRADNAILVVSGAITASEAESLARQHFSEWEAGATPAATFPATPTRDETRVYFVHRPGSVQSNILVGNTAIRPDSPDYYALQVLNRILGGGTDARLFLILREEKGWTYGAYSQMTRPKDVGYLAASAEVRNEVTDSALVEILSQLKRLRTEPVPADELEAAKSFLVGSFPLRIETPGQIARQLAQNRLLGLPDDALTEHRERTAAVTAEDVQRVAREHVRPDQAVVVVVGDATKVLDQVAAVAPVTLYDVEGEPLDPASLTVRPPTDRHDASALREATLVYQLEALGNTIGTATTNIRTENGEWVVETSLQGMMSQESEVRFLPDFTPVSSSQSLQQGPMSIRSELSYADARVTGTVVMPAQMGGERQIDTEVVAGTLLPEMDQWYLAAADLQAGRSMTVPTFDATSGSTVNVTYAVGAIESVTVPAGTFDAYRVDVRGLPQGMVLFLRAESPHILVRQEYVGQPVVVELTEVQ